MQRDWMEDDLVIDGARLHYMRTGDGSQPPVVLVHGFSDNGRCWPLLARDLSRDYDVVMPDARGHGKSARVAPGETVDLTADLAGVIRALDLAQPVVVGHSMGAATAAQLAARHPDLLRALILEDPPWHLEPVMTAAQRLKPKDLAAGTPGAQTPSAGTPGAHTPGTGTPDAQEAEGAEEAERPPESPLGDWIESLQGLAADELVQRHRDEHPVWPEEVVQRWSEAKLQLDRGFFHRQQLGAMSWEEIAAAIACPTLLITADPERGGIVTPDLAQEIAERNPCFTVVHIPGTGHHVRFEAYEAYWDAVQAFLSTVRRNRNACTESV